jgi:predicted transcriptional regulator
VISPDASVEEAARKMKGFSTPLPVCDGHRLLGLVTDRDITVRAVAQGRDPKRTPVREIMSPHAEYGFEDDDVYEAARRMKEAQIRRLVVLDREKRLVGIVALEDLALQAGAGMPAAKSAERISEDQALDRGEQVMALHRTSRTAEGTERYRPSTRNLTGRNTVAGLFRDRDSAERAIEDLKAAGFTGNHIGIVVRDPAHAGRITEKRESDRGSGSHAASGAVTGLVGGGLLGGLAGYLLAVGALTIPGIGPVIAGGALVEALGLGVVGTTAAVGAGIGAAAGGLVGALVGMGIPEEEARYFEKALGTEEVLLTVKAGERVMEALAILETNDADTGLGRAAGAH